uniref:hypothetical protein n=1 Tax=Gelidibacter sp. TaxID=2018083 RepID=UPI0040493A0F
MIKLTIFLSGGIGVGILVGLATALFFWIFNSGNRKRERESQERTDWAIKNKQRKEQERLDIIELKDKGLLTEKELESKLEEYDNPKPKVHLTLTKEFNSLERMFKQGKLSKEEFDSKVDLLKKSIEDGTYIAPKPSTEKVDYSYKKSDYSFKRRKK